MKTRLLFLLILTHSILLSQNGTLKPIGSWTEHLPYQKGTSIDIHENTLYCGTTTGLFTIDLRDNSIGRFSTVNRLNQISVDKLKYSAENKCLIVIYEDLNIDLLKGNQTINIPSIKDANIDNKDINEIFLKGPYAYLSTGFGIVKMNIERNEISETYQFAAGGGGIKVNSSYVDDNQIFAATDDGIFIADLNSNLLDFNNWQLYNTGGKKEFLRLFEFNNELIAIFNNQNSDSLFVLENNVLRPFSKFSGKNYIDLDVQGDRMIYVASDKTEIIDQQYQTLSETVPIVSNLVDITFNLDRIFILNTFDPVVDINYAGELIALRKPKGPFEVNIFDVDFNDGILWAVPGGYNQSINNLYRGGRLYKFENGEWTNYIDFAEPSLNGIYDMLSVSTDPNNANNVFVGCWGSGLVEFRNDLPFRVFDEENSILRDRQLRPGWTAVGETKVDENGNLWIVNSYSSSMLAVRASNGNWFQYNFNDLSSGEETAATDIEITDAGYVWVALDADNHILVFDNNNTLNNQADDQHLILRQGTGSGNIPGIRGIVITRDLDNQLWIGTSDGIAVHYNPDDIFSSGASKDFERVLIDAGENVEELLVGTEITDIVVDGANRKWVATNGSGVFLLSSDGKTEILKFTTENSPLFSNSVLSIALDEESGEVYMATANGLISYRSDVVAGSDNLNDIKIFPNPVREDYEGNIAIDGLIDQTTIKITDIEGRLVNEIESTGGRALWNGQDFKGQRVSTGVYLVFASGLNDEDNLKTAIGKILFIR